MAGVARRAGREEHGAVTGGGERWRPGARRERGAGRGSLSVGCSREVYAAPGAPAPLGGANAGGSSTSRVDLQAEQPGQRRKGLTHRALETGGAILGHLLSVGWVEGGCRVRAKGESDAGRA